MGPGLTGILFLFGKSSQHNPKLFCLHNYTLLKVVGYYDLSVLSMSVMGFQKKFGWGVGGWGELYPIFFGFLEFF